MRFKRVRENLRQCLQWYFMKEHFLSFEGEKVYSKTGVEKSLMVQNKKMEKNMQKQRSVLTQIDD